MCRGVVIYKLRRLTSITRCGSAIYVNCEGLYARWPEKVYNNSNRPGSVESSPGAAAPQEMMKINIKASGLCKDGPQRVANEDGSFCGFGVVRAKWPCLHRVVGRRQSLYVGH